MLLLKSAASKVREQLTSPKLLNEVHNSLLFQLVFLSAIKDYLGLAGKPENLFIIPEKLMNEQSCKQKKKNKKILVLDMDQTLVHTRSSTKPRHGNYVSIKYEGEDMFIEKRPFLDQFLDAVNKIFDIWVYTAGNKKYADLVLNQIDPKNQIFQRRFYRDTCKKANGTYYKDLKYLKKISKVKEDMILVDDNKTSVGHNYPFAVQIQEFQGQQQDKGLLTVFQKLLKFYGQR